MAALVAALAVPPAHAGGLAQHPGLEGCISEDGSGPCTDGDLLHGAFSVAVASDGKNVYVGLLDGRALAVLARDKKTGALTQLPPPYGCLSDSGDAGLCTPSTGVIAPFSVAVSPDGRHVYVASFQEDPVAVSTLTAFTRDTETGALTQLAGTDGCISEDDVPGCRDGVGLRGSATVAVTKDGTNVYVASEFGAVAVFGRDAKSGVLTQLAEPWGCVSRDGSGGRCTPGRALARPRGLAVSNDGAHVYVGSINSAALAAFGRDARTGALTQLPGADGCIGDATTSDGCAPGVGLGGPMAVAVSASGKYVYAASYPTDELAVLRRDRKTGALTQLPPPSGCISQDGSGGDCTDGVALDQAFSVAVSRNGRRVYVAGRDDDAVAVFSQNKKTGVLTQLPPTDGCIRNEDGGGVCTDGRALRDPRSVAVTKDGKHIYVAAQGSRAVAVLQRAK